MSATAAPPQATGPRPPGVETPAEDARSRWRRRLMLLGVVPLVFALVLTLKVALMLHFNDLGRGQLSDKKLEAAAGSFAVTRLVNVFEPWIAPYDQGVVAYAQEQYDLAALYFEEALPDAPEDEQCRVRINLALVHEALGDAALADGDVEAARGQWREGRTTLSDGGCASARAQSPTSVRNAASGVDRRLAKRLADTKSRPGTIEQPPERAREAAADLRERNQKAEERRHEREERLDQKEQLPPPPETPEPGDEETPEYEW